MEYKNDEIRLNKLIDAMTAIASLDFSKKLEVSENQDILDVVSLGFNMLSEALEDTVVSKQHLEVSEKKYKSLFSKANDVILLIKDGEIIDFNEKTLEIFGYTADELRVGCANEEKKIPVFLSYATNRKNRESVQRTN